MAEVTIRRGFADLPDRQVHHRRAGSARDGAAPLVMLHGAPGSARQLEPLMAQLARTRLVFALDAPGYGDSTRLANPAPAIADYAAATLEALDAMGIAQADFYGTHTGANIAIEIAIARPARVRRLALEGIGLFPPAQRAEYLARYAPAVRLDPSGAYLASVHGFLRDLCLFWPWYEQDAAHRRATAPPPPAAMHAWLLEVLKAHDTFHLGYAASFGYLAGERLPLVAHPCLAVAQPNDPLLSHTQEAAALLPHGRFLETAAPAAAVAEFLDAAA